jgi:hypothetical protein
MIGMQETPGLRSPPKGLWWKSLLAAWLGLRALAAVAAAVGVRIPDELGFPMLAVTWVLVWMIWRRWAAADDRATAAGAIGAMQRIWATYCVALVLIGVVVLTLDNNGALNRTGVSGELVASGVTLIGILSLVGGRVWVPRLTGSDRASIVKSYQNRFFVRVAWAEAPALLAFGGFLLLGGEAWVYLIGLTVSLAGLGLAAPTRSSLHRDQEQLDAAGKGLNLLESLSGSPNGRRD